ncbi:MAG: tetratricopeptide repeat protein [Chloracidobacterium sp.]|nr:tetratricopeptide repeat protein [Chloracidobacterium sp.]
MFLVSCGHSTSKFLAKGEEYLQKRKFNDALMQFRSAVESDKESAAAHWGMARAYENLGQFNETLEELRKTVDLDGSNLEAKAKLGNYFLLLQPPMIAETEKIRDEILAADSKFIEGHILGASILAAQGKPDSVVIDAINKAIALDPKRIESYISLERLYTTREKAAEAEAAILRGIEANPTAILGYTEYGRFLTYADRDADAELQFKKAIEIDAKSIEAHEAIADFYVTSRQLEKAEAVYKELVQIQENSPESRLELAEFYTDSERVEDAINVLQNILTDTPEYVRARYKLGQIYLDRKDIAGVNEQLDALFAINDIDSEALTLRARLKIQQNKPDEAVKDLEEVIKTYPSGKEALFLMAQVKLSLGQIDQGRVFITDLERYHPTYLKTGLLRIQAAFSTGEPETALKLANELINKANAAVSNTGTVPQETQDIRVRALTSRGLAYLDLGKTVEAKADLQEIVRLSPHSSAAMVNLAKVSIAERNYQEAFDLYDKALALDTQNFDAVSGVVTAAIQLNQTQKAHAKTDELIAAYSGRNDILAALRYLKSTIFSAEKNPSAAEQELLQSINLDENYLQSYSAYATLLVSQSRTDEAIAQYQKVVEKRPSAQVFTMLGILEDGRGKTADAEMNYRRALEIAPETAIAANNLAWLIAENQGNLDEALQLATSAVSKNQAVAGFYDTLGSVFLKKGLYSPAVEQLKKAVALDETNAQRGGTASTPGYRVRLGMALAKAGDKVSARREAETSLRSINELSQREVSDAKNLLANL